MTKIIVKNPMTASYVSKSLPKIDYTIKKGVKIKELKDNFGGCF